MSNLLPVFVVTPYSMETASPFLVVAAEVAEAIAVAESYGLKSFVVECGYGLVAGPMPISSGAESLNR